MLRAVPTSYTDTTTRREMKWFDQDAALLTSAVGTAALAAPLWTAPKKAHEWYMQEDAKDTHLTATRWIGMALTSTAAATAVVALTDKEKDIKRNLLLSCAAGWGVGAAQHGINWRNEKQKKEISIGQMCANAAMAGVLLWKGLEGTEAGGKVKTKTKSATGTQHD